MRTLSTTFAPCSFFGGHQFDQALLQTRGCGDPAQRNALAREEARLQQHEMSARVLDERLAKLMGALDERCLCGVWITILNRLAFVFASRRRRPRPRERGERVCGRRFLLRALWYTGTCTGIHLGKLTRESAVLLAVAGQSVSSHTGLGCMKSSKAKKGD